MVMRREVFQVVAVVLACAWLSSAAAGERVKAPCTRDVWVSAVPSEQDHSMGRTTVLKLKSIQEMAVLDFDVSALRGRTVTAAWLHFRIVENLREVARMSLPFRRRHLLKRIGVSTVSADWAEGAAARAYRVDRAGFGATFREASYSRRPWAGGGGDLSAVVFGSGNSLQAHAELEDLKDMWARVPVPPRLVCALVCRSARGLCVMDEIGYCLPNSFIHSRESKPCAPYLLVDVAGADRTPPAAPTVSVAPAPRSAHLGAGAATIDLSGPADAFCYFVRVNGRRVPQWRVPYPLAGRSRFVLDDRGGAEELTVEAVASDAAGNRSPAATAKGRASPPLSPVPAIPPGWRGRPGEPPVRSGRMRVWALPEVCKVDPVTGAVFEAKALGADPGAFRRANGVWDGRGGFVRLFGARGEIAAFQLCLERTDRSQPLTNVSIGFSALSGPGKIAAGCVRPFRIWYTPVPEYALPMAPGTKLTIPPADNRTDPPQNNQLVYVDVAIPRDAAAGDYTGAVRISAAGVEPFDVPVRLRVYGFALPDRLRFNPELNVYNAPARAGSKAWFEAFRTAHYNRCTLSLTMAAHSDRINGGVGIAVEGEGAEVRVKDWSRWDSAYGPLLDGSAFKDLPRAGVPLATCQVPLSHGYPLKLDRYYRYAGVKKHKNVALAHALTCEPIERAFPPAYQRGWQGFARQIVAHFERSGWTRTHFMFYLDAKVQWRVRGGGTSYWTLDEPYHYDDWAALRFWGRLFRGAIDPLPKKARWGYRCDISRPQWTHDWLDGVMTMMYVGGLTRNVRAVRQMARRDPRMGFYSYGACNDPSASNWNSAAWCLMSFLAGADGVLPWQSLGTPASLKRPDKNGLIVPRAVGERAVASVRVKALRRGAQDCEYLLTLAERRGYNREQLRALVARRFAPTATLEQLHADDAAPVRFDPIDPDAFVQMREGIAKLIVAAGSRIERVKP